MMIQRSQMVKGRLIQLKAARSAAGHPVVIAAWLVDGAEVQEAAIAFPMRSDGTAIAFVASATEAVFLRAHAQLEPHFELVDRFIAGMKEGMQRAKSRSKFPPVQPGYRRRG